MPNQNCLEWESYRQDDWIRHIWIPKSAFGIRIHTARGVLLTLGNTKGELVEFEFDKTNLFKGFFGSYGLDFLSLGVI